MALAGAAEARGVLVASGFCAVGISGEPVVAGLTAPAPGVRTKVAWRDECDIGLEFVKAHDLTGATTAELKTLRRYCVDHGPSVLVMDDDHKSREPAKPAFGGRRRTLQRGALKAG